MIGAEEDYVQRVVNHQARDAWYDWMSRLLSTFGRSSSLKHLRVLDYGCGPGRFTSMLAEAGCDVLGIDPNPSMIDKAKEKYPGVRFECGYVPTTTESFDAVFCTNVLGHTYMPEITLQVLRNRLAPGGRLVIFNPNLTHTLLRWPVDQFNGYKPDPTLIHHWTLGQMTRMVERVGFQREWAYFDGYKWFGVRSNYAASFIKC